MPKLKPAKIKFLLLIFIVGQLFFSYVNLAYAADSADYTQGGLNPVSSQIATYLCAPTPPPGENSQGSVHFNYLRPNGPADTAAQNNTAGTDLYNCINKIYRFAIAFGSVLGIGFIVVAGYVYMAAEGNQESVQKAKDIFVSSITAMVILFGGYVLLRALNPDLLQFHNVQPPTVIAPSGGIAGGGISTTGGPVRHYTLAGYDIGPYATAAQHEQIVASIYNRLLTLDLSTADKITQYMNSSAQKAAGKNSPLTGQMVLNAASSYSVDIKLILALMEADSHYGSDGDRAIRNFNPGNVGNTDSGANTNYGNWQTGVNAVASWLSKHRA